LTIVTQTSKRGAKLLKKITLSKVGIITLTARCKMKQQTRYHSLDFLRGIAVLLVMFGHFLPGYLSSHLGWTGVDLFFVLSGFFVSGILFRQHLKERKMRGDVFFLRRIFKIWPLFYICFFLHLVYFYVKHTPPSFPQVLAELFFVQDYYPGFIGITWSLAIEEQFYVLVAILLPVSAYYGKLKWIVPACITIMVSCLILRIIHYYSFERYTRLAYHFPLHFRADALSAGIVISWYYHFHYDKFKEWVVKRITLISVVALVLLLPMFIFPFFSPWIFTIGFTSTWLGYSGIVILCIFLPAAQGSWNYFFNRNSLALLVAWVGFYSYAIYLFHVLIGPAVQNNILRSTWSNAPLIIRFLIFLISNIVFGYVVSSLIEQPILRWRNRILPSKSGLFSEKNPKRSVTTPA
jgi:peptidoglycan/LPS O-acetylase OafA/YrhL